MSWVLTKRILIVSSPCAQMQNHKRFNLIKVATYNAFGLSGGQYCNNNIIPWKYKNKKYLTLLEQTYAITILKPNIALLSSSFFPIIKFTKFTVSWQIVCEFFFCYLPTPNLIPYFSLIIALIAKYQTPIFHFMKKENPLWIFDWHPPPPPATA